MKKYITTLAVALAGVVQAMALTPNEIREEARFLSDRMAYELNLTPQQYEDCYEINYDFIASINPIMDDVVYGYESAYDHYYDFLNYRNEDLRYILSELQYTSFLAREYFLRPIYLTGRLWRFRIHQIYQGWSYYYAAPRIYHTYYGGHGRHHYPHGFYGGNRYSHRIYSQPHRLHREGHHGGHYDNHHGTPHRDNGHHSAPSRHDNHRGDYGQPQHREHGSGHQGGNRGGNQGGNRQHGGASQGGGHQSHQSSGHQAGSRGGNQGGSRQHGSAGQGGNRGGNGGGHERHNR